MRYATSIAFIAAIIIGFGKNAADVHVPIRYAAAQLPAAETTFSKQTFTYKTVGSTAIQADVYRTPGTDQRPVLIWIHPGALILGSRAMLPEDQRDRFISAGFIVVAIDYRLAPETKLPDILQDVVDAHHWVRERGPALFGGDPVRFATVGASAGGYLALMAGSRVRPRPKAVVAFYGYGDVSGEWYSRPDTFYAALPRITREAAYSSIGQQAITEGSLGRYDFYVYCRQTGLWPREVVGFDPDTEPAKFAPYSAEQLVSPEYPPTLLLHGDRDVDVPFKMSERMAGILARERVQHQFIRLQGFNHAFDVFSSYPPQGAPTGMQHPRVIEAFDSTLSFLKNMVGTRNERL
jgi:acetyl esterase/lipase